MERGLALPLRLIARRGVVLGLAAASVPRIAAAQTSRPVTAVVPFAAGGVLDALARILTQNIGERGGSIFVVENRPGVNGTVAARAVGQSSADAQTWLFGHDALITINHALYGEQPGFDPRIDLVAACGIARSPSILVVNPEFGPRTVAEFVELGRRTEIPYASGGIGAAGHMTMEQFGRRAGLKLRHVPYRGGAPATNDVIAGQVPAAFLAIGGAMSNVEAGKLRALAVSTIARSRQAPTVPTIAESGFPGFEAVEMYFAFLPARTPPMAIEEVSRQIGLALADPAVEHRIRTLGIEPVSMDAAASRAWLEAARDTKTKLVTEIGLKPR